MKKRDKLFLISMVPLLFILLFYARNSIRKYKGIQKTREYTNLVIDDPNDYLISFSSDSFPELGSPTGYTNTRGDTIIPLGKYSHCWTDTFQYYGIVYDSIHTNGELVGIDQQENILFHVVLYDNWPDEPSEGLFRIKRNEKIGYANEYGEIVIPCRYACAYPFRNGKAQVTYTCKRCYNIDGHRIDKSDEWFFIDHQGNRQ